MTTPDGHLEDRVVDPYITNYQLRGMANFVVHEHHAEKAGLHHDLRIEMCGILVSWAIPKLMPLDNVQRLAVKTVDHDRKYLSFEGVLPPGYGAGLVTIWDIGICEIMKASSDYLKVHLGGRNLKAIYTLRHWEVERWLIRRTS